MTRKKQSVAPVEKKTEVKVVTADDWSVAMVNGDVEDEYLKTLVSKIEKRLNNESTADKTGDDTMSYVSGDEYAISPPFDFDSVAIIASVNTYCKKSIDTIARHSVGLGYNIILDPNIDEELLTEAQKAQFTLEKERLKALFGRPNDTMSTTELMRAVKVDEETVGQGYVEVGRDSRTGQIRQLFYVQASTFYVRDDGDGKRAQYVQVIDTNRLGGTKKKYFKAFGDSKMYSRNTGELINADSKEPRAAELLRFYHVDPRNGYYGYPRFLSAISAISENYSLHQRSQAFMDNDCLPRFAIICDTPIRGLAEKIDAYLKAKGKGSTNYGRCLVVAPQEAMASLRPTIKIEFFPTTDKGFFIDLRVANEQEIRACFGLGPVYYGTSEDVNKSSADVMRRMAVQTEFVPESEHYEYIINSNIVRSIGCEYARFQFIKPVAMDPLEKAEYDLQYTRMGALDINDARRQYGGLKMRTEDWAQLPYTLAIQQIAAQGGSAGVTSTGADARPSNSANEGDSVDSNQPDAAAEARAYMFEAVKYALADLGIEPEAIYDDDGLTK